MNPTTVRSFRLSDKNVWRACKHHIRVPMQDGILCGRSLSSNIAVSYFSSEVLDRLQLDETLLGWHSNWRDRYCKTCLKSLDANL